MRTFIIAIFVFVAMAVHAQPLGKTYTIKVRKPITTATYYPEEEFVCDCLDFQVVEHQPIFPGGDAALINFLSKAPYPHTAQHHGLEGSVTVKFVIDKRGQVNTIAIEKSSGSGELDKAAINHICSMPGWTPGKQRGKPVNVHYQATIIYTRI